MTSFQPNIRHFKKTPCRYLDLVYNKALSEGVTVDNHFSGLKQGLVRVGGGDLAGCLRLLDAGHFGNSKNSEDLDNSETLDTSTVCFNGPLFFEKTNKLSPNLWKPLLENSLSMRFIRCLAYSGFFCF